MSYTKDCNDCKEKLLMQQVNGKWVAYSSNGTSFHKCSKVEGVQLKVQAAPPTVSLSVQSLNARVKRLEKIMDAFLLAGASSE